MLIEEYDFIRSYVIMCSCDAIEIVIAVLFSYFHFSNIPHKVLDHSCFVSGTDLIAAFGP